MTTTVNDLFSQEFIKRLKDGTIDPEMGYIFITSKYGTEGFATEKFPDKYDQEIIRYYLEQFLVPDESKNLLPLVINSDFILYSLIVLSIVVLFVVLAFGFNRGTLNYAGGINYECGFKSVQLQQQAVDIQFFQIGMLFLLFDVEILLFFPWALNFYSISKVGHFVIFIFFILLCLGFYYELTTNAIHFYPRAYQLRFASRQTFVPLVRVSQKSVCLLNSIVLSDIELIKFSFISLAIFSVLVFIKKHFQLICLWTQHN
jgi:NADH-ubiquinone oxidoreductase chain 3